MKQTTFLLIGPCQRKNGVKTTGGVIVLFENLLAYCRRHHIPYKVIDTNKANYPNRLIALSSIIYALIKKIPRHTHIALHGTKHDFIVIAPLTVMLAKLFKKGVSLRKFAGNFDQVYQEGNILTKYLIRKTLQASSVNFFETDYLVKAFQTFHPNTYRFPNVRDPQTTMTDTIYRKRFLFIGSINQEKGIDILCQSAHQLSKEYLIDIYGTLEAPFSLEYFQNQRVNYRGLLRADEVINVIRTYDVLILPSFREGYPGVIIEAFSIGMPVIATRLQGIQEMVTPQSALLIEPDDAKALTKAIESINQENYTTYRDHAIQQFQHFNSEPQTALYFDHIRKTSL